MMGFPVQNEGTALFCYPLIIEGRLEALMWNCKQSVHSSLCGNDIETSRGTSAEIRGSRDVYVWERVNFGYILNIKLLIRSTVGYYQPKVVPSTR